jgi:hypothetical protein
VRLGERARVRVTLLSERTNQCDADLLLLAPTFDASSPGQRLWSNVLSHIGESTLLGPYASGTELIFGLAPRSYCSGTNARPSPSRAAARIAVRTSEVWDIWWEDYQDDDFNDLVVRVEALPVEPAPAPE